MIKILKIMLDKKITLLLFSMFFLGACTAPTAMMGPALTLSSSGSISQAGLSYGSTEFITFYTGKTPLENIKEITDIEEENIQKETLESEDFYILVKNKIKKAQGVLNLSNQ